MYQPKQL